MEIVEIFAINENRKMIEFLKISNMALLESAEIEFGSGFTAVTGETGAGKSVLLGALAMLSGARCGKEVIGMFSDTCRVDAILNFNNYTEINALLDTLGLPPCEDGVLTLSRTISRKTTSRAFVNSAPTTLSALNDLGECWIDFHGPGEPQKLFSKKNQLAMLDLYADNSALLEKYRAIFNERERVLKELDELAQSKSLSSDEVEFLKGRIASIDMVSPSEEKIAELEEKSRLAEAASEIVENSAMVSGLISGDDGALMSLASATRAAEEIADCTDVAKLLSERLRSACVELADIASEYDALGRSSNMSEEEIATAREEMTQWLSVSRKFGPTVKAVLESREEMVRKIETQSDVKATIAKLEEKSAELLKALKAPAESIMKSRKEAAKNLTANVGRVLLKLGFKNAKFEVLIEAEKEPSQNCGSVCEFQFSANPGSPVLPLAKIASSGELARVMLAIKTILAEADSTPLLVFDEVDANVGGEIGAEVGAELAGLAGKHQVFCVTHLPQVAARATAHLLVEKSQTETSTSVSIRKIDSSKDERIKELARMLGDRNSPSALAHAEKLLNK